MPLVTKQTDFLGSQKLVSFVKPTASVVAACYLSLVITCVTQLVPSPPRGILKHNQKSREIGQADAQDKL